MSVISVLVQKAMKKTAFTPVIINTKPDLLSVVQERIAEFKISSRVIPRFNWVSAFLPAEVIDDVAASGLVNKIWLDREMRIPEQQFGFTTTLPIIKEGVLRLFTPLGRGRAGFRQKWTTTFEARQVIEAHEAESMGFTGRGVTVAVIDSDSGFSYANHPQLRGRVVSANMTVERGSTNGHGGHVTTTVLGGELTTLRGVKVKGVAPAARGLGVKALMTPAGIGMTSDIIAGIGYAVDNRADVINMSLGGPAVAPEDDPIIQAIEQVKNETIFVCASGNDGPEGSTGSPAVSPDVISVGAINPKTLELAEFSSRGKVDVTAPGVDIYSGITAGTLLDFLGDYLDNGFSPLSGTSMATPMTAGIIALAVEAFRRKGIRLTTEMVKDIAARNGEFSTPQADVGHGLIRWSWFREGYS